jgi:hypothetical protein
MNEYEAATYGEHIAEVYDDWYAGHDTEGAVEFLSGFAKDGNALELGIGTGRVALPLSARGGRVASGDCSPEDRVARGGHPPPAPTERSVRISRTTLFGSWFTA